MPPRILNGFVISSIEFDDAQVDRVNPTDLLSGWNNPVAPSSLKHFGDDWVAAGRSPMLAVPSAVVPGELNYLINPAHPEFAGMVKSVPEPFTFDYRLG